MGITSSKEGISSDNKKYLGIPGAWALAFGCSVGWGSFVMPGTTFLPIAGPVGSAIGLTLGGIVTLLLAVNYHYLMNKYPDSGGAYTYTKLAFGYDHGFVSAWFLILTYMAIIWANATALPLIMKTVVGDTFQVGFLYEVAGFPIYFGEIFLALGALVLAALVCLYRKPAEWTQIIMAAILFGGVIICFAAALGKLGAGGYSPAFAGDKSTTAGVFTIFALAPWAFVGFESISHSAAEARFSLKKSFGILAAAVITATVAYVLLTLMAVKALPDGCKSWEDYIGNLGDYSGISSVPTFHGAYAALGEVGRLILGAAAMGAIFTGLVGNYIALSRLIYSIAEDGLFPEWFCVKREMVPRNAILAILIISAIFPFLGRTTISWIVDVTTIGATIAYVLASASAYKTAKDEKNERFMFFGLVGVVVSVLFALAFLIPNIFAITTLSTQSYLILSIWSICGLLYFRVFLNADHQRRLGRSIVTWVVLLGLIIYTSSIWMHQTIGAALTKYQNDSDKIASSVHTASHIQLLMIIFSLIILLNIYGMMQRREKAIEVEKLRAEKTSQAKSSFLSNMSHEIRTPMNAIIGLQKLALKDPELKPETRSSLEKIGASADHLLGLINDILDMSRIESGRMMVKKDKFAFRNFLDKINTIIEGQCQEKRIKYSCNIIGDVEDYYVGDDLKLSQVLINILGNAVKFTNPRGSISLVVEQLDEKDGICQMRFIMSDTGIGMDPEYIPKIFETFSQEEVSNTSKYGGSGLGMAITKNLVEMMEGEILVESVKGEGSTFTVTVPLALTAEPESAESESVESKTGTTAMESGKMLEEPLSEERITEIISGKRILMAEDVDQNAEILTDLLELEDVIAARARNGEEAVMMFSKSEPGFYAAILMDVRMPVMDGLEATRTIRKLGHPDAQIIPIIAMTANVFDEDVEHSRAAGMDAHLSKPVDPDILYETMARLILERTAGEVD